MTKHDDLSDDDRALLAAEGLLIDVNELAVTLIRRFETGHVVARPPEETSEWFREHYRSLATAVLAALGLHDGEPNEVAIRAAIARRGWWWECDTISSRPDAPTAWSQVWTQKPVLGDPLDVLRTGVHATDPVMALANAYCLAVCATDHLSVNMTGEPIAPSRLDAAEVRRIGRLDRLASAARAWRNAAHAGHEFVPDAVVLALIEAVDEMEWLVRAEIDHDVADRAIRAEADAARLRDTANHVARVLRKPYDQRSVEDAVLAQLLDGEGG